MSYSRQNHKFLLIRLATCQSFSKLETKFCGESVEFCGQSVEFVKSDLMATFDSGTEVEKIRFRDWEIEG